MLGPALSESAAAKNPLEVKFSGEAAQRSRVSRWGPQWSSPETFESPVTVREAEDTQSWNSRGMRSPRLAQLSRIGGSDGEARPARRAPLAENLRWLTERFDADDPTNQSVLEIFKSHKGDQVTIVIKAARIFDGKSEGLLHNLSVLVEADQIAGLIASARVPSGADVIDLGDVTLTLASLTHILI